MIHATSTDRRVFEVSARLSLQGPTEFLGVQRHIDRPPTATIRVCGVELEFTTPADSEAFAAAAATMAAEHQRAADRADIARETLQPQHRSGDEITEAGR